MPFTPNPLVWKQTQHESARLQYTMNFFKYAIQAIYMLHDLVGYNKIKGIALKWNNMTLHFPNDTLIQQISINTFRGVTTLVKHVTSKSFYATFP